MPEGVLKVVLRTGLNVYRKNWVSSRFVTERFSRFVTDGFLVCSELSKIRSISCTNLIFLKLSWKSAKYEFKVAFAVDKMR